MNLLKDIERVNYSKKIKIRAKELADGSHSLYLDIFFNNKRQYQTLRLYLSKSPADNKANEEKFKLAIMIRDKKELDLIAFDNDFSLYNPLLMVVVASFFRQEIKTKKAEYYTAMVKIFEELYPKLLFKDLALKHCEDFYVYLKTKLKPNSASLYFAIFRHLLSSAVKKNIIKDNFSENIRLDKEETKREYLTIAELQKLILTDCKRKEVKNAFLFSCFTGLRYSDIIKLSWKNINGDYIEFKQQKTGSIERIKLSASALDLLSTIEHNTGKVFHMCKTPTENIKIVTDWSKFAGITKHITFHCARHTFATMCLTYDIDIFTVSKLLGHKDIKTTQIYAKLIDKKKDDAIDKLPDFSASKVK
jgi:integrase